MENEILNLIDNYWKFDNNQQPAASWHEKQALIEAVKEQLRKHDVSSRFDQSIFVPPFRLGRKQKRAVLDANGREVIIMSTNSKTQAQKYVDYLNGC